MNKKIFRKKNLEIIPRKITHLIWDIDGTITEGDKPDEFLVKKILKAAELGCDQTFLTGRDAKWMGKILVSFIIKTAGRKKFLELKDKIHLFPELALLKMDLADDSDGVGNLSINPIVKDHPLIDPNIREEIAKLFFQPSKIKPYKKGDVIPSGFWAGKDANGDSFLFPEKSKIPFPDFIWSDDKRIIGTAEIIRDLQGKIRKEGVDNIDSASRGIIKELGKIKLNGKIDVSPVSTAINIVPIVWGRPLDKDAGARTSLQYLSQKRNSDVKSIAKETFAIGDGKADLLFCLFPQANMTMGFVGPPSQFSENTIAAEGVALWSKEVGIKGTREILKTIFPRIENKQKELKSLAVFITGKQKAKISKNYTFILAKKSFLTLSIWEKGKIKTSKIMPDNYFLIPPNKKFLVCLNKEAEAVEVSFSKE